MCVKRYGNDGLKITSSQLVDVEHAVDDLVAGRASASTSSAPGSRTRDSVVPKATKKVAMRCTRSLTRPWPNSMMPRKPASRKNAVSTS